MPTISEAIAIAIGHHRAGRLSEAEQIYRQVLAVDPNCVDAWNLLSVMASQLGQHAASEQCARRAAELKPDSAELHYNLAFALQGQRKLDEAIAAYRRTLELEPRHARAHNNLGHALQEQGQMSEAIACHRQAAQLQPDLVVAHYNLANALKSEGRWDEAIACYRRALELQPHWPEALSNLGVALQGRGEFREAAAVYRQALTRMPDSAELLSNLGSALQKQGEFDEAVQCYRRAVELGPDVAEAQLNLAMAIHEQGSPEEALPHFHRALALRPQFAEAENALGLALRDLGRLLEARQRFERALALKPDYAEAHTNHAMLLLQSGDFARGWPEYEWRWKGDQLPPRDFAAPAWDGGPLNGRTILLYAEQGLGDTLQFIRYAALVKELGATVLFECPPTLSRLLASCPGVDRLISRGDELPAFDVHAPLLSLPRLFKTSLESVPAPVPYLFADPALVSLWRERLGGLGGFRIGINWRGRAGRGVFRKRDIPLECFTTLGEIPDVRLISLQKGNTVGTAHSTVIDLGNDVDEAHGPFMDTAAIMMNLDLVITSDTSVAHLAAALGVPVWVALPFVASWQWLLDRQDSPWYPTVRLFRQKAPGDWRGVFAEVQAAVRAYSR